MLFAAVIVPIVRYPRPALIVVRRAAHLRRNPGQIAFPGGLIDPGDADSETAALREFEEELGIPRARVRIVDRLDDVVTLAQSVTVAPYVGSIDPPVAYARDAGEIASVHEIPLADVYAPNALRHGFERVEHDGATHQVPSWLFDFGDGHIWGATGDMLAALVARYPDPSVLTATTA